MELDGRFHSHPYRAPDATGLGRPLKSITHPLRPDLPVLLGAEGPKNVAQTIRIADGWLPLYWSPNRPDAYGPAVAELPEGFRVAPLTRALVCDDVTEGLLPVKAMLGFYIGGMGHATRNFHADLMARMGYEEEARRIQELFLAGFYARRPCSPYRTPSPTRSLSSAPTNASPNAFRPGARAR